MLTLIAQKFKKQFNAFYNYLPNLLGHKLVSSICSYKETYVIQVDCNYPEVPIRRKKKKHFEFYTVTHRPFRSLNYCVVSDILQKILTLVT